MIFITTLATIIQTMAISLGVGSSTLAIVNFFVAISDGSIDETERKMMGVVYVILRISMVLILITTLFLLVINYTEVGYLTSFDIAGLIILLALFVNSVLMTAHIVPSTLGPAIQAGNWYSLGILSSLNLLGYTGFSVTQFLLGYIAWIILAIAIVNGTMSILKSKRENKPAI